MMRTCVYFFASLKLVMNVSACRRTKFYRRIRHHYYRETHVFRRIRLEHIYRCDFDRRPGTLDIGRYRHGKDE